MLLKLCPLRKRSIIFLNDYDFGYRTHRNRSCEVLANELGIHSFGHVLNAVIHSHIIHERLNIFKAVNDNSDFGGRNTVRSSLSRDRRGVNVNIKDEVLGSSHAESELGS